VAKMMMTKICHQNRRASIHQSLNLLKIVTLSLTASIAQYQIVNGITKLIKTTKREEFVVPLAIETLISLSSFSSKETLAQIISKFVMSPTTLTQIALQTELIPTAHPIQHLIHPDQ
jgi:hypothetical protein